MPERELGALDDELIELARVRPRLSLDGALASLVPQTLGQALIGACGLGRALPLSRLARDGRRRLARALCAWPLDVRDSRGWNHAEATAGGVPLDEVDAGMLESRCCRGLHLAEQPQGGRGGRLTVMTFTGL